jgi:uncharacterized BrkB/YihY/UPF0761 family membrane protein
VWMYLMAAIAILGCEFNAEFERLTVVEQPPRSNGPTPAAS